MIMQRLNSNAEDALSASSVFCFSIGYSVKTSCLYKLLLQILSVAFGEADQVAVSFT